MDSTRRTALGAAALLVIGTFADAPAFAEPRPEVHPVGGSAPDTPVPAASRQVDKDRLALASTQATVIESASWSVQTDLRKAHAAGDRARAQCLDELLTRMHVAGRTARALREAIEAAIAREDASDVDRLLVRLAHLRDRTSRLAAEASRCGDREVVIERAGATVVRVIKPRLPEAATGFPGH